MSQHPKPTASEAASQDEEWFREYAPQGVRYATAMLHNRDDAEEAVQDAFVKILKSDLPTERRAARFFTAVRNLCIDLIRKRTRKKLLPLEHVSEPASKDLAGSESRERLAEIQSELEDLPAPWKQALNLKLNENKTYAEIAQIMSASHAQIRSWIFRARQQLRERLLPDESPTVMKSDSRRSTDNRQTELSACQIAACSEEDSHE